MKKSLKWIVMLSIVFFFLIAVILFNFILNKVIIPNKIASMPEPSYPVTEYKAKYSSWNPSIKAIGFIRPNQSVELTSETAGKITSIRFKSGQLVKKGDILVTLDSSTEQAQLDSYTAKLPFQKAEYERYLKLVQTNSVSQASFEEKKSDYFSALADINGVKADINKLTIKAPFDGIIGLNNVALGQYINSGSEIAPLDDINLMELRVTIPQTEMKNVFVGQEVKIKVGAYPDKVFEGKIEAIAPGIQNSTGLVEVQVSIPNYDNKLKNNMYATANIMLPIKNNIIMVPKTAISYNLYGNFVYVVKEDKNKEKRVSQIFVNILSDDGEQVVIDSGIKENDMIVTSGQVSLNNGSKVYEAKKSLSPKTPSSLPDL